ncbi:hypothetical protein [Ohtaekwangia sp.]|uniref:hypothetical protein n=1 Tax=Ohtaekwangia sp. TaxID=2066019 RepID=UPI002F959DD9
MTKRIITPYFPNGMKYFSALLFAGGIYLIVISHWFWGALIILTGIIILTTKYVTEIDLKQKKYRDYLSFLIFKLNEDTRKFNAIDRIVITKGNYSQTLNTRVQSRQMDWSDYTGTLVFDSDTLDLLTKNTKQELLKGLKEFTEFLNVGVEDRTTNQYYWVDMAKV